MRTFNVNDHRLMNLLHRPERGRATGKVQPLAQQDKRAEAHVEPDDWMRRLMGDIESAEELLRAPPADFFDQADAVKNDALLSLS